MTKNNDNKNESTLKSWATGKLASIALGLAVVYFIHKTGMVKKAFSFFKSNKGKGINPHQSPKSNDTGTSARVG